jgi:hypothetical protein
MARVRVAQRLHDLATALDILTQVQCQGLLHAHVT